MIIKELKESEKNDCGFGLAVNGKMGHCGKPAVAITGKIPLCLEHSQWAISMKNLVLKDCKGREVTETHNFIEKLKDHNG